MDKWLNIVGDLKGAFENAGDVKREFLVNLCSEMAKKAAKKAAKGGK